MIDQPALIGIDWGSSSLRAWLIGADGTILAERSTEQGASRLLSQADFTAAFDELTGVWRSMHPALPVLACGMIGSSHGWLDVPYVYCPADGAALSGGVLAAPGGPRIVPGLATALGGVQPDLMRGEETQIVGALHLHPELNEASCIVLPGTHSKWSLVAGGRIVSFATWMTGELYAVLRRHSVLGRLMSDSTLLDRGAFLLGVTAARDHGELGLSHQLFAARSLGVTQRLSSDALADYLSGVLIGHELRSGLAWRAEGRNSAGPLVLVGEPQLCTRYQDALQRFDQPADLILDNVATAGLLSIAQAAGLLLQ